MVTKDRILSTSSLPSLKPIPGLTNQVCQHTVSLGDDYVQTRSGLLVPPSAAPKPKLTHFDAFCGAGGFGLGVTLAGFHTVGAFDFDVNCALTYMYNLCSYPCRIIVEDEAKEKELEKVIEKQIMTKGKKDSIEWNGIHSGMGYISHHPEMEGCPVFILGDVRNMSGEFLLNAIGMERGELDLMTGGPPCQGFSYAGKRNVADPRNNLVYEFARLICEMQPKTIVMENVPGIISMTDQDGVGVLDRFCFMLENGGWGSADAVKKMLTGNPKDKMVIRTRKPPNKTASSEEDEETEQEKQTSFLQEIK